MKSGKDFHYRSRVAGAAFYNSPSSPQSKENNALRGKNILFIALKGDCRVLYLSRKVESIHPNTEFRNSQFSTGSKF